MTVAVAVLAAGGGARIARDTPKPLLLLRSRPLVAWALDAALASGLEPVLLVVGNAAGVVGAAAPAGVEIVRNHDWQRGIARSLRAALGALEPRSEIGAVCVGLADQPRVGPEAYRRLAAAYDGGAPLAVATYGGIRGNPVLVGRVLWGEAMRLDGDVGVRALMRDHAVVEVACDRTGTGADVDTLDDLAAMEEDMNGTGEA